MKRLLGALCGLLGACSVTTAARAQPKPANNDPPPIVADLADPPLYGDKDGLVFLRDRRDFVRLYPHAQLDVDAHGALGRGVNEISTEQAGIDLAPRFFVRRARLELGGELLERIYFDAGIDLAYQPAIDGARVDGQRTRVALGDAWTEIDVGRGLYLRTGLFQSPVSLENRSANSELAMMERNVAVRGFVSPGGQVLAATIGGAANHDLFHWDVGASLLDRLGPDTYERGFDGIGRMTFQPISSSSPLGSCRQLEIGVSGRLGARNARDVTEDAPAITTGQGFPLWRPTEVDAGGQTLHVTPSGTQWALGGELRTVLGHGVALRGEVFWVSRNTRESATGAASPTPQGLARLDGIAAYAEVSVWLFQALGLISGEPPVLGAYPHSTHLELARTTPSAERYGLEIAVLGATIQGKYASREGIEPFGAPRGDVDVYQLGLGINYWHTRRFRLSLNPTYYLAPGNANLALVPGALVGNPDAQALWEIAARTTIMF